MKPTPQDVLHALADGKVVELHFTAVRMTDDGCCVYCPPCPLDRPCFKSIDEIVMSATRIIEPDHIADASKKVEPEPTYLDALTEAAKHTCYSTPISDGVDKVRERIKAKDELLLVVANAVLELTGQASAWTHQAMVETVLEKAFPEES